MNQLMREWTAVLVTAVLISGLSGCAGAGMLRQAHDAGGALGVATQHCAAYGPLKTTKASKGTGPKVRFGAAIVCEK